MFRKRYYQHYYSPTPLGTRYEYTLGLSTKEVGWLNKFTAPDHGIVQIEPACQEAVRLYLFVLNELETRCKSAGTTLQQQAKELTEKSEQYGYFNYKERSYVSSAAAGNKVAAIVYFTIFQRCAAVVRQRYQMLPTPEKHYFTTVLDTAHSFKRYFGEMV